MINSPRQTKYYNEISTPLEKNRIFYKKKKHIKLKNLFCIMYKFHNSYFRSFVKILKIKKEAKI